MHQLDDTPSFIAEGLARRASDWHLTEGERIFCRVEGELRSMNFTATREVICSILGRDPERVEVERHIDGSFTVDGEFFRLNGFLSRGRISMAIRHLERKMRSLKELGVPAKFTDLLARRSGILLVTGSTGSGKTTSLTAAVDYLNHTQSGVLITLEDPIEYLHESHRCIIRQREYRKDFHSFPDAIVAAMRQDPDYLVVAEMRDYQTISAALTLAETGHLVLSTLHSATAADAITRILDAVPDSDKSQQRSILSKSLLGVLSQQLLPSPSGRRIGVFELMVNTTAISALIREGRFGNIVSDMSSGSRDGMVTMDQSLEDLVRAGKLSREVALANATNPKFLADKLPRGSLQRA